MYEEATAIAAERIVFVSLDDGSEIEALEVDSEGGGVSDIRWSPDGRAVLFRKGNRGVATLHRIGSEPVDTDGLRYSSTGFASDGQATTVLFCNRRDTTVLTIEQDGSNLAQSAPDCLSLVQARDRNGNPFVLYLDSDYKIRRVAPGGDAAEVVPSRSGWPGGLQACDRVVVAQTRAEGATIYEVQSGRWAVVPSLDSGGCPVADADGSRVAYTTGTKSVEVVDLTEKTTVEVAVSGSPLAFDATGQKLLVAGGGLFVVNIDGSGGEPASVSLDAEIGQATYCRLGDSGKVLLSSPSIVGLYDVAADELTTLDLPQISSACFITDDAEWVLADGHAISVTEGQATSLHAVDLTTGERVRVDARTGGSKLTSFVWSGPFVEYPRSRLQ
jgi:hypothetical protein